ncbi:hypothetical protein E2562_011288 [Oryza meyeriana var. granulata]|uniref:Uncharacterized protein n=1 Tax=Oryza meyeriana var. granulata TaxID=110450 RepID=A0A6G1BW78_9ORYZ|nr:hypothetical protein E2562_011288 [Oryza meyeriana var. granulata]
MPHLNLESLFCGGGGAAEAGSRVACETIALPGCPDGGDRRDVGVKDHTNDADAPAESRCVRIGEGAVWAELAGAVLERDGSTKGSSNPKAAAASGKGKKGGPRPPVDSRMLPMTGKAAVVICGLPAGKRVAQKRRSPCLGRSWRRPAAAGARIFAREAVETDPGSPKVSCFGAVRSERRAATAPALGVEDEERSAGCWASVAAGLHHLCRSSSNQLEGELEANESKATAPAPPAVTALSPPRPVAVGLGDVKRLASRRWPETVAGTDQSRPESGTSTDPRTTFPDANNY